MHFAASMFFTDYSMAPHALARAMEERGFESVWAPEHSHIPVSRKSTFIMGGDLPKKYCDVMDPFVTLTAAALATTTLKIGTGICLVNQRDPIQTAKLVASIDHVCGGRFLFGIGHGWNQDEMENHGTEFKTRHKLVRERVEAMKQIWTQSKAEYHGDLVDFDPLMAWPKPLQKPHPPVLVGGAFPYSARRAIRYGDGWMPQLTEAMQEPFTEVIPRFRQMAAEAGREPDSIPISVWGRMPDYDEIVRYRDMGVVRVCTSLESETEEKILPVLDKWAALIRRING
jgi:probable F420-dependent oxidoreductase